MSGFSLTTSGCKESAWRLVWVDSVIKLLGVGNGEAAGKKETGGFSSLCHRAITQHRNFVAHQESCGKSTLLISTIRANCNTISLGDDPENRDFSSWLNQMKCLHLLNEDSEWPAASDGRRGFVLILQS